MLTLAWTYLRIGMIFFGGGYVLIPLLQHLLVEQYKWLTLREFLDGVAISQLTPGPLAMLATFTGVRVGGFTGGLIATVCIFAPCIVFMLVVGRYYARLKEIDLIRSTLDNILPAVVGLVASAAWSLGATLGSLKEWIILVIAFCIFRWTKVNPMVMILGAGLIGMFL
jgi:chromate transporter